MKIVCQHLNIMFSQIQPEYLFNQILQARNSGHNTLNGKNSYVLSACCVGGGTYKHYAYGVLSNLTPDEIKNMYLDMLELMEKRSADCGGTNVFSLLPEYTMDVLEESNGIPCCRCEQVLDWRECYLRLGQDLLVTSHMAYERVKRNVIVRSFCWPAQIHTDDTRLNHIIQQGMAENHFHLNGSARIFDISWLCLMNHPDRIRSYLGSNNKKGDMTEYEGNVRFRENLNSGIMLSTEDEHWSWEKRLYVAAWVRAILFQWMLNGPKWIRGITKQMRKFVDLLQKPQLTFAVKSIAEQKVETVRFLYSAYASFRQGRIKKPICLDYAAAMDQINEDKESSYRVLSGERALLYTAFLWIFSGKIRDENLSNEFKNLFYLYLLLKTQFRNEMIQVNGRLGFRNFASYENRKDVLFDIYPDYKVEAYNTSIVTAIRDEHVVSHELRITPKDTARRMLRSIWQIDQNVALLQGEKLLTKSKLSLEYLKKSRIDAAHFYTLHFVKQVDEYTGSAKCTVLAKPRNSEARMHARKQAFAIAKAMEKYNYLCARIRGIDACNFEIGCRPDTFATEFRFLREFIPWHNIRTILNRNMLVPQLSVTYHAGEDFLDLADGLRAIDEAILFLEFKRGDRLGHAVALGISPETYYRKKEYQLVVPKQNRLDDIVWLLFRSRELNIAIDSVLQGKMETEAYKLYNDIFGHLFNKSIDLNEYYQSWHIRGDDPEQYRYRQYKGVNTTVIGYNSFSIGLKSQYDYHRILRNGQGKDIDIYRKNKHVATLFSAYHYDDDVKKNGSKMTTVSIEDSYVSLIMEMQTKLQNEIALKGIAIECNPSSNVLITPISSYVEHPIFRFTPVRRIDSCDCSSMYASVNTDDQGIFDTSLANEYALLMCAASQMRDRNGERMYSDDEIYEYLGKLRMNGITQEFPKAKWQ